MGQASFIGTDRRHYIRPDLRIKRIGMMWAAISFLVLSTIIYLLTI